MSGLAMIRGFHQVAGRVAPGWTTRRAQALFTHPRRLARRPWEDDVEARAARRKLRVGWSVLSWKPAEMPRGRVLCMHGWEGKAAQWGVLADELVGQGYEVVALDGPGHGASPEDVAHPVAFGRALLHVEAELGPFDAVVGHSMGGAAVLLAMSWGLQVPRAAVLAAPSSMEGVLTRFSGFIGLPASCNDRFVDEMVRLVGFSADEFDLAKLCEGFEAEGLIVHDVDDDNVPVDDGRELATAWRGSRLVEVRGPGHHRVMRDEQVLAEVVSFVGR